MTCFYFWMSVFSNCRNLQPQPRLPHLSMAQIRIEYITLSVIFAMYTRFKKVIEELASGRSSHPVWQDHAIETYGRVSGGNCSDIARIWRQQFIISLVAAVVMKSFFLFFFFTYSHLKYINITFLCQFLSLALLFLFVSRCTQCRMVWSRVTLLSFPIMPHSHEDWESYLAVEFFLQTTVESIWHLALNHGHLFARWALWLPVIWTVIMDSQDLFCNSIKHQLVFFFKLIVFFFSVQLLELTAHLWLFLKFKLMFIVIVIGSAES